MSGTNEMLRVVSYLYVQICTSALFHMLAPTCYGSGLPSSGSFWIRLSYVNLYGGLSYNVVKWPVCRSVGMVQICALCWVFILRLIVHGTNIK
jgi:hypothetical protein